LVKLHTADFDAEYAAKNGRAYQLASDKTLMSAPPPFFARDVTNPASISAAATLCDDTTVLVNNAGIGRITSSTLEPAMIDVAPQSLRDQLLRNDALRLHTRKLIPIRSLIHIARHSRQPALR
jgi:NAD(P)-dependent dehydrogenase (short-subunit alcohol dehydrogenase family)